MEKLQQAGLFGGGLTTVSGPLVARYNDCLAMLGIKPVKLKRFQIDGLGWSPEVAAELKDDYYLNLGDANSYGIILSPEQFDQPIYRPFHSFDRDLMYAVFTAYQKEIKDITKDSAICLHVDQGLDTYYESFDLLKIEKVSVHFKISGDLDKNKAEQMALIEEYNQGNNFFHRDIHKKLLASALAYGDLRDRKVHLEPISVEVNSFYTKAFGGVFVLRDFIKEIMVFESMETFKKSISNTTHEVMLFHKEHEELHKTLVDHLIVECNLKRAETTPKYTRIKKHLLVEHLKDAEHPMAEILENEFLYKRYFNTLSPDERKLISGVEIYNEKIAQSNQFKRKDLVDYRIFLALHEPHSSIEDEHRALIWKLLVKIMPLDPVALYWFDKESFYELFPKYDESYQDWIIERIKERNKEFKL
ncbi:hypothetical protein BTO09_09450 [Gilvibacter sp. SZ-19]|uniref:DUF6638 family protein n=1 Tax=Gilvibacter sp. SZ-19 TaxID=754429 RepID=UPI000B3D0DB5|nr:DUF6638 family protein [Gilvibacter sp. SZ-19]ARV12553.1 hypothetical protein BTO09_09450 [Gilvibacter sp. SZ-19]